MDIQLEECDFILYTQSTPHDFGVSPLQAKVLNFAPSSHATRKIHVTSNGEHEEEDHEEICKDQDEDNDDKEEEAHEDACKYEGSTQFLPSEKKTGKIFCILIPKPNRFTRSKHVSSRASPKDRQ